MYIFIWCKDNKKYITNQILKVKKTKKEKRHYSLLLSLIYKKYF